MRYGYVFKNGINQILSVSVALLCQNYWWDNVWISEHKYYVIVELLTIMFAHRKAKV